MALYTFHLELEGFTCIQQSSGPTLREALVEWANAFANGDSSDLPRVRKEIAATLSKDSPTPVKMVHNVWCVTGLVEGKLALMNISETRE